MCDGGCTLSYNNVPLNSTTAYSSEFYKVKQNIVYLYFHDILYVFRTYTIEIVKNDLKSQTII